MGYFQIDGPKHIKLTIFNLTFGFTDTDTCMHICILTADYTVKPVLSSHSKKKTNYHLTQVKSISECSKGSILQYFNLH